MKRFSILALLAACNGSGNDTPPISSPAPMVLTVSWSAPARYVDGTPLPASAIAGYRIAYGTSATALSTTIDVPASTTARQLSGLQPGTYFVTVRTIGTNGQVSPPAGPASAVAR